MVVGATQRLSPRDVFSRCGGMVVALALLSACGGERPVAQGMEPYDPCESTDVQGVTTYDAAAMVEAQAGSVSLVMFYASTCSLSRAFFPMFLQVSSDLAADGLEAFAFSTEECPKDLHDFLADYDITFTPTVVLPWEKGELGGAFAGMGLVFTSPWTKPLVAVIGRNGVVAQQWSPTYEEDAPDVNAVILAELAK